MLSQLPDFEGTWVFFSGWGTDSQLVSTLTGIDWICPPVFEAPLDAIAWVKAVLETGGVGRVSLLGFSMGAYVATIFSQLYPEYVDQVVLVGVRPSYPVSDLEMVRAYLRKQPELYMQKFYEACTKDSAWLVDLYVGVFSLEQLAIGLNFLEAVSWSPDMMPASVSWWVVHGDCDVIAPYEEIAEVLGEDSRFITVSGAGHLDALFFLP